MLLAIEWYQQDVILTYSCRCPHALDHCWSLIRPMTNFHSWETIKISRVVVDGVPRQSAVRHQLPRVHHFSFPLFLPFVFPNWTLGQANGRLSEVLVGGYMIRAPFQNFWLMVLLAPPPPQPPMLRTLDQMKGNFKKAMQSQGHKAGQTTFICKAEPIMHVQSLILCSDCWSSHFILCSLDWLSTFLTLSWIRITKSCTTH